MSDHVSSKAKKDIGPTRIDLMTSIAATVFHLDENDTDQYDPEKSDSKKNYLQNNLGISKADAATFPSSL